jgi:hypothetical protein
MNIVEQINDGITTVITTTLGVTYSELSYLINVEKNNFKANTKRYGVRPLAANTTEGITRVYTVNHSFQVILTHDYFSNPSNDQDQRDKTFLLYDKLDEIMKNLFINKAGLPSIVLNIDSVSIAEPEYFDDEKVLVLRADFNVKYRQAVNC